MVLRASPIQPGPAEIAAQWASVASGDPVGGLFAHPAFARCFRSQFADRAEVFDITVPRADGRVGAVLSMMRCKVRRGPGLVPRYDYLAGDAQFLHQPPQHTVIPVRQISPIMGLEASALRLHLTRQPDVPRDAVWRALAARLAQMRQWDMAVLPLAEGDLDACAEAARAAGLHAIRHPLGRAFHSIETPLPQDGFLARTSQKFRQNIRRAERFAEKEGAAFDILEGDDVLPVLPEFATLAASSWKAGDADPEKGGATRVGYAGGQRRFYESLCRAQGITPILFAVRVGGALQSACLCFWQGGCLTTALIFQLPARGAASYGRLVLHRAFQWAYDNGAARIDLNSNAEWVQAYSDQAEVLDHLLLFPRGPYAAMLRRLALRRGTTL